MPNSYRNPNVSYRKFSFYELNGYDIDLYHGSDSDREDDDDKDNQSDSDFCDDEKIVQACVLAFHNFMRYVISLHDF